jgi:hypothetical protein
MDMLDGNNLRLEINENKMFIDRMGVTGYIQEANYRANTVYSELNSENWHNEIRRSIKKKLRKDNIKFKRVKFGHSIKLDKKK